MGAATTATAFPLLGRLAALAGLFFGSFTASCVTTSGGVTKAEHLGPGPPLKAKKKKGRRSGGDRRTARPLPKGDRDAELGTATTPMPRRES